jgi:hypothetical protein
MRPSREQPGEIAPAGVPKFDVGYALSAIDRPAKGFHAITEVLG